MRLCEFETSSSKGTCGKELFAWARYKRGDVPESGEFAYIDGRVKAKFPSHGNMNAHLRYHLCYPYDCNYLRERRWIMCRTKWEVELHIKQWHNDLDYYTVKKGLGSLAKNARCRPVKMVVSWEPANSTGYKTKGGAK